MADFDLFIIGGGINGCGIARDAAGRGFSVCLAEMRDLASGTSSGSTKLIHGGLRYLEHYEFRLVREALMEREVLWANAPHIIWPLRFVLPHHKGLRPAWLLRLGLFLYDHLGGRKLLPATRSLDLASDEAGRPLKPGSRKAFEYSDCWVNDARLVVLNARDAAARGVEVNTRTRVEKAVREKGHWRITLVEELSGTRREVTARLLVNAAGPWVDTIIGGAIGSNSAHNVRLVQGSHIVVRKLYDHNRCYIFQNADGRIIFAIPYEQDFTLIGTTDQDYRGDPAKVHITEAEIDYLCSAASEYFTRKVTSEQIVWTYSGVRPLYDDGASKAQEATRDYVLKVEGSADDGALINIFGGKITTYRRLAESVLEKVEDVLGKRGNPWTHGASLPGGDFPVNGFDSLAARIKSQHSFLSERQARRFVRLYGTEAATLLAGTTRMGDLGRHFGADLYEREVAWQMDHEWAVCAEDAVWRRTKLGLVMSAEEIAALDAWMADRRTGVGGGEGI